MAVEDVGKIVARNEQLEETLDFIYHLDDNVEYGSKEYYDMLMAEIKRTHLYRMMNN